MNLRRILDDGFPSYLATVEMGAIPIANSNTRRLNTIEYAFPMVIGSVVSNTDRVFTPITVYIPNTVGRVFRSVLLVWSVSDDSTSLNDPTNFTTKIQLGSATVSTSSIVSGLTNTGESWKILGSRDCTAYFEAHFGSGTSQTFAFTLSVTATQYCNAMAKVIICYEYDSAGMTTGIKTVRMPIPGNTGPLTTSFVNVGGVSGNIPSRFTILTETTSTCRSIFLETWVNTDRTNTAAAALSYQYDGATTVSDSAHVGTTVSPCAYLRIDDISATLPFNSVCTLLMKTASTQCPASCAAPILVVTYEYPEDTTVFTTNSIIVPLTSGFANAGQGFADRDRLTADFWIEEPGTITLLQSGVMITASTIAATVFDLRVGNQPSRLFTFAAAGGTGRCGGTWFGRTIDAAAPGGAGITLARGKNTIVVDVFQTVGGEGAIQGYAIINYSSGKAAGGTTTHNRSHKHYNTQFQFPTTVFAVLPSAATTPPIPEASYYLQGAHLEAIPFWGALGVRTIDWMQSSVSVQPSEGVGGGWIGAPAFVQLNSGELGFYQNIVPFDRFRRYPGDADPNHPLDIEQQRTWRHAVGATGTLGYALLGYTYHSITVTKTGTVYAWPTTTGDGSNIVVTFFDSVTFERLGSTITKSGGVFSWIWYDDVRPIFATAAPDATHTGRSQDSATGTLDIYLGRTTGSVIGAGGIIGVAA